MQLARTKVVVRGKYRRGQHGSSNEQASECGAFHGDLLELMVSVLPYERTVKPSPKNQPRSDGAYLKDYDSTQEFGFSDNVPSFSSDGGLHMSRPRMQQNPQLAGFGLLRIGRSRALNSRLPVLRC
ncbi:hypothetical protein EMIT0P74_90256 [Pseudomonas sp. IT-P74]